jgi:thiamine-monophosphate kinase
MTARGRLSTPGQSAADLHHLALGSGVEFDLIRTFLREWSAVARGVGGDCAVLDVPAGVKLVVSTDTSVENVHFRSDWLTPTEIGYRAAAAALSDLAAAAATPFAVLLALSAPPEWRDRLPDVARGIGQAVRDADAAVVGGDTTAGPALSLTVTVLGTADRPLTRGTAQVGDRVYVTGTFGGPAAAVSAWTRGGTPSAEARARFAHPTPRWREARWLATRGATAAIDVSDGLIADLGHLAAASKVHVAVDLDRVPRWPGITPTEAAASGEEYELAVTMRDPAEVAAFAGQFDVVLTQVGDVLPGPPGVEPRVGGARVDPVSGYDHFSR